MERRRMIKAAAALLTLGYCSLLVYQGGVTFNFQESRPGAVQVSDLSIEPVTKTTIYDSGQTKNITLDDIFITVKTTRHHQYTRLPIILKTWFQLAKKQIWFFTDTDNRQHQQQTNGHMVNTNCSATHQLKHLCCKTSVEYDRYLESGKKCQWLGNTIGKQELFATIDRWFCHFDDDNYVNVPRLVTVLQKYDHTLDWYLGRMSVNEPIKMYKKPHDKIRFNSFWFATGGAGFCISRSLALKMLPVASGGRFMSICERIRLPDDVTMGFIIEQMVNGNMTFVPEFHSHLESMKLIAPDSFKDQISFGYSRNKKAAGQAQWNVLNVPGFFDSRYDPTRFLSLHCFLFPHFEFCPR